MNAPADAPLAPPTGFDRRAALLFVALLCLGVVALWAFPPFWYTRVDVGKQPVWLKETRDIPGWTFREIKTSESAERTLMADQLFCGAYTNKDRGTEVLAFGAERYSEKPNDIGLFVHTPDRCWTESGWRIEPAVPDSVEVEVQGIKLVFERRIFSMAGHTELVYFGGLVGGQPLPYRLDHNLSVGIKQAIKIGKSRSRGGGLRASDERFWKRVWESFVNRRELLGPKQFLRVSTATSAWGDHAKADALLAEFLNVWLARADYAQEIAAWHRQPPEKAKSESTAP